MLEGLKDRSTIFGARLLPVSRQVGGHLQCMTEGTAAGSKIQTCALKYIKQHSWVNALNNWGVSYSKLYWEHILQGGDKSEGIISRKWILIIFQRYAMEHNIIHL